MGLVDESLMRELPRGVSDMVDHGYALTKLDKINGELECGMVIGIDDECGMKWRITDDGSETMRIQFQLIVPVDDRLIDILVGEDGVDRNTARNVVKSLISNFVNLRDVVEESGSELSLDRESDRTKMEFFDITISRDLPVATLIHLSQAVVEYDKYSMDELDKVGAKYL